MPNVAAAVISNKRSHLVSFTQQQFRDVASYETACPSDEDGHVADDSTRVFSAISGFCQQRKDSNSDGVHPGNCIASEETNIETE